MNYCGPPYLNICFHGAEGWCPRRRKRYAGEELEKTAWRYCRERVGEDEWAASWIGERATRVRPSVSQSLPRHRFRSGCTRLLAGGVWLRRRGFCSALDLQIDGDEKAKRRKGLVFFSSRMFGDVQEEKWRIRRVGYRNRYLGAVGDEAPR